MRRRALFFCVLMGLVLIPCAEAAARIAEEGHERPPERLSEDQISVLAGVEAVFRSTRYGTRSRVSGLGWERGRVAGSPLAYLDRMLLLWLRPAGTGDVVRLD